MIKIFNETKIYIACPANIATGGPLALHQLGYKLKKIGFNVFMFYIGKVSNNPTHVNYQAYKVPYVFEIEDDVKNFLIVAERNTDLLFKASNIRSAVWWLSIDNFFKLPYLFILLKKLGISKPNLSILNLLYRFKNLFSNKKVLSQKYYNNYFHFSQSAYAYDVLKNKFKIEKKSIYMLTDYLLEIFFKTNNKSFKRQNIVLYNPTKGSSFTQKLIDVNKNLQWIAIQNMTPKQVRELLLKSKLYIDFGEHPGRDRFPREAVISGCCLITGKRGSAKFYEDIPINDEFKFFDKSSEIINISKKINLILSNYNSEIKKFNDYKAFIQQNENIFEKEILNIFKKSN